MPVNLDAIRKKMAAIGGGSKFWKHEVGEYRIRVVPWNPVDNLPDGEIFPTLWFYNLGQGRDWQQIAAPNQFGMEDPIEEVLNELWKGDEDDKAIAKKLRAGGQTYVAFLLRGKEERGIQVWKLPGGRDGQVIHQKLLSYFLDTEVIEDMGIEDWTDPNKGLDIKVTVTETDRVWNGKKMLAYAIEKTLKTKKLSDDQDQAKKWLDSRPSLKEYYTLESPAAIKSKLEKWLSSGPLTAASTDTSEGTSRGTAKPDALDEIANDVKKLKQNDSSSAHDKDKAPPTASRGALDDALRDLESDE